MTHTFPNSLLKGPLYLGPILALAGCLLLGPQVLAQDVDQPSFPSQPGLEDYLQWSSVHHPAVTGAESRAEALDGGARAAGALPDLRFGWGEMIVPVETRVGPQQRVFSLSQSIPWFGTLGLKEAAAESRADAAGEGARAQRLAVHQEVRSAWYELAYLGGEIRITNINLDLARQAESSARSVYEGGSGSFADVLSAGIDREKLAVRLAGLADRLRPATTRLNLAAGMRAGHEVPDIPVSALEPAAASLPADEILWKLVQENNPELAAYKFDMESRRRNLDLAGKAGYPGLTFGVDYIMTGEAAMEGISDSGKDPVIARVGVSIPLWGGKVSAEKEASAGWLRAAGAQLGDARIRLNNRFETALYSWREAGRNSELYGQVLLDTARQALDVTTGRYRSGQASYLDLVSARQTLLGLELAHLRALADRALALNELATLTGLSPEELADRSNR